MCAQFFYNEQVFVNIQNKKLAGTIKYIGELFYNKNLDDPVIYYGIDLQTISKTNKLNNMQLSNGSLNKVCFFKTKKNRKSAIFVKKDTLIKRTDKKHKTKTSKQVENIAEFTIEDCIYYNGKKKERIYGIIRFVGIPFSINSDQLMYGILLSKKAGNNNGIVNGRHYFECMNNYGIFATNQQIKKAPIRNMKWKIRKKYKLTPTQLITNPKALNLLICGICNELKIKLITNIPPEIMNCIFKYCKLNKILNKYTEILYGKTEHKQLGNIETVPILFKHMNDIYVFDICVECQSENSMKFYCSYKQKIENNTTNIFRNNANEYKCTECGYFAAYNVKIFVISQYSGQGIYQGQSSYSYISPFATGSNQNPNNKTLMKQNETKESKICFECKSTKYTVILVDFMKTWEGHRTEGGDSRFVGYCKKCKLFSYSGHHC
eukprot:95300_1